MDYQIWLNNTGSISWGIRTRRSAGCYTIMLMDGHRRAGKSRAAMGMTAGGGARGAGTNLNGSRSRGRNSSVGTPWSTGKYCSMLVTGKGIAGKRLRGGGNRLGTASLFDKPE
jgi:hypothetical protein